MKHALPPAATALLLGACASGPKIDRLNAAEIRTRYPQIADPNRIAEARTILRGENEPEADAKAAAKSASERRPKI